MGRCVVAAATKPEEWDSRVAVLAGMRASVTAATPGGITVNPNANTATSFHASLYDNTRERQLGSVYITYDISQDSVPIVANGCYPVASSGTESMTLVSCSGNVKQTIFRVTAKRDGVNYDITVSAVASAKITYAKTKIINIP